MYALKRPLLYSVLLASFALGCDHRNIEPYVPGEQPRQPDLSKIFPAPEESVPISGNPMRGSVPPSRVGFDAFDDAEPIRGTIVVGEGVEARAGGVLFIVARRPGGQGSPFAVKRIDEPQFPLEFSLGAGDSMIPDTPFAGSFQISARLDGDGNVSSREPGDLQGAYPEELEPGATGFELVLDTSL